MKLPGWIPCVALTLLSLAACGGDPAPEEAGRTAADTAEGVAPPETATGVEPTTGTDPAPELRAEDLPKVVPMKQATAATAAEPDAPIEFRYQLTASPEVGQPLLIDFALVPQKASPALRVMVATSGGLGLQRGSSAPVMRNVQAGAEYWDQIVVVPEADGAFNVNVIATLGEGPSSLARTFSIPVMVGAPPAASEKTRKNDASVDATGPRIEPVPGQESR